MLEIYLGNLKDLLVPQPSKAMDPMPPCLSIQTDPKGGVEIDNLVAIRVTDFNHALRLYRLGCRFRSTASTNSNMTSSRSHCLIRLSITCFDAPERRRETNKIWFIDLGGSERILKTKAWGRRLDEGKAINLSLSALGDVIHALQKKNFHVPYRNSKLTQVLKDSLGGDSKTLMLVHVSPNEEDLCETVCTLNFATRVRSIHLGNTDSTEEKKQREIATTNLQKEMKRIEDERQDVRRNIKKLNEELECLTGTAPSSNEQLDASHLLTKFNQHNLESTSKTTEVTTARSSRIPRFMKPTVSSRRKSGADYQRYEERVKVPARRRRVLSQRAESVSFPVKRTSEYSSDCSISRNSCLVYLNVKSNADDETEYSQDTTECDIKNVIVSEQETSSKSSAQQKDSIVNSDRDEKGKKNSSSSTNLLKVDNWLRLHKNEPTISNVSHESKRVLAIPIPEKKRVFKKEKEDNLPNRNDHQYKFTNKKLEKCAADVAGFGRSKQDRDIHKLPITSNVFINRESSCNSICSVDHFDGETTLCIRDLIDRGFIKENKCGSSFPPEFWCTSLNLNQDSNRVNEIFVLQEENSRKQGSDGISEDNNAWNLSSPSDSMSPDSEQCEISPSKVAHTMLDTREDSGSSISEEQEVECPQVPTEIGLDNSKNEDTDTADQSSAIELRPGILKMRTQRALFLGNKNPKEPLMASVKSRENTENSGIRHLLIEKVQIFWAGVLLALGVRNLGLEDEFFQGLVL